MNSADSTKFYITTSACASTVLAYYNSKTTTFTPYLGYPVTAGMPIQATGPGSCAAGIQATTIVYTGAATPSPTPSPSPTIAPTATPTIAPTATPSPAPTASPAPVPFRVVQSAALQLTASDTVDATLTYGCSAAVASATVQTTLQGFVFTLTPLAAGACTFTLSNGHLRIPFTIVVQ